MTTIKDLQDKKKELQQLLIDHKESMTIDMFFTIINQIHEIDDMIKSVCN